MATLWKPAIESTPRKRRHRLIHYAVVGPKYRVNVIVIGDAAGAFLDAGFVLAAAASLDAHFGVLGAADFLRRVKVAPLARVIFRRL
jgi:hypothetical protein